MKRQFCLLVLAFALVFLFSSCIKNVAENESKQSSATNDESSFYSDYENPEEIQDNTNFDQPTNSKDYSNYNFEKSNSNKNSHGESVDMSTELSKLIKELEGLKD